MSKKDKKKSISEVCEYYHGVCNRCVNDPKWDRNKRYMRGCDDGMTMLQEDILRGLGENTLEWFSTTERLPPFNYPVLCMYYKPGIGWLYGKDMRVNKRNGMEGWANGFLPVICWCDLNAEKSEKM